LTNHQSSELVVKTTASLRLSTELLKDSDTVRIIKTSQTLVKQTSSLRGSWSSNKTILTEQSQQIKISTQREAITSTRVIRIPPTPCKCLNEAKQSQQQREGQINILYVSLGGTSVLIILFLIIIIIRQRRR